MGAADNTLVYHRFDPSGAPDGYDTLEDAAPAPFLVTGAQFGDNDRLLATWAYECGLLPCQELLSLSHVSSLSADWSLPLERDGSNPVAQAPALEVGPEGDIYLGAAFPGDAASAHLQLRRIGQGAAPVWTNEALTFTSSAFRDVVTTSTSVYVGGSLDERAAIAEYSFEGERLAVYYVDGEEVSRLAAIGDELVYAAAVQDIEGAGVRLGRLSATGESKWSVMSERAEGEQEWAWDLARDSLGHVHVLSVLSSGQARLQRVAL